MCIRDRGESVSVCLTGNGEAIDYTLGDAITEPARYVLTITDRLGNRTEISFEIVRSLVKEFVHDFSDVEGLDKMTVNGDEIQPVSYTHLDVYKRQAAE